MVGDQRAISTVIGSTQVHGGLFKVARTSNQNNVPTNQTQGDLGAGFHGLDIKDICRCDLLFPYESSLKITVGKGLVYPISNRTLHGNTIREGYVKVQVDTINVDYEKLPLPLEISTDEVIYLCDARSEFIQWPLNAIKLLDTKATLKSTSTSGKASIHSSPSQLQTSPSIAIESCYYPEFAEPDQDKQFQSHDKQHIEAYLQMSDERIIDMFEDIPQVSPSKPKPNEEPNKKITEAWNTINSERPPKIQNMAAQLTKLYGDNMYIAIPSPLGMYPTTTIEYVQYEGVLQLFANEWVDNNFIHWCEIFCRYLYEMANSRSPPTQCAYLNTSFIIGGKCIKNANIVQAYINFVYEHHKDKKYFLAPFLHNAHWSLLIFSPSEAKGYIADSLMGENKSSNYPLLNVIEESFGFKFKWKMVECK
ncbi:hypothetical protein QVD17_19597 [Tagetes erecta]|uniref:DUF8039 domain-containing protein n=1 Tax=Tagetes erecta TaxID=13708 RepID=A0AAD8KQ13_TARER|nr:hypothetical protein QVD17_19597 [Tagetes erecta]